MVRLRLKPFPFVAMQFFILSLSLAVFFDPIGISYFVFGIVYLLSKKLAILEVLIVFILKGEFGYALTAPAWSHSLVKGSLLPFQNILTAIFYLYIPIAFLFGTILAVQTSASIVRRQLRKKAPDVLGMLTS